jgi:DNA-binding MarR family transcriptional regulator
VQWFVLDQGCRTRLIWSIPPSFGGCEFFKLNDPERALLILDELETDIGIQVHIARRAIWQSARKEAQEAPKGIPSGYASAIVLIGANPGVTQKRIAEELFLDAGSIVDIVDMLERDGLADRRRDPADRRRQRLYLTDAGMLAREEARQALRLHQQKLAARLTEAEALELARLLKKLRT